MREAVDAGVPVLGICLGAQMLARAMDRDVYPAGIRELAFNVLHLTPEAADDRLMSVFRDGDMVFHWHEDTFDPPDGATILGTGDEVHLQAFRDRRSRVGFAVPFRDRPCRARDLAGSGGRGRRARVGEDLGRGPRGGRSVPRHPGVAGHRALRPVRGVGSADNVWSYGNRLDRLPPWGAGFSVRDRRGPGRRTSRPHLGGGVGWQRKPTSRCSRRRLHRSWWRGRSGPFDLIVIFVAIVLFITNSAGLQFAGPSVFVFWIVAFATFLITGAFVTAQLGRMFPEEGSLYVWTHKVPRPVLEVLRRVRGLVAGTPRHGHGGILVANFAQQVAVFLATPRHPHEELGDRPRRPGRALVQRRACRC